MSNIRIRDGIIADIPALTDIENDAGEVFREIGYDFCADMTARQPPDYIKALDDGALLVAETDQSVIAGFALLWIIDQHAHLEELSVAQKFQGKGIGKQLVAASEEWARKYSYDKITLITFAEVVWNKPFYEKLGYEVFTPDETETELRYIQTQETEHGLTIKPRVAMMKKL
ncbi:MAG: N-acetyltransferase GCN5 [Hyphococcus sp.]|nr:MAG: N-acetyltransferase GCN5 [Marinicaulis sp.]